MSVAIASRPSANMQTARFDLFSAGMVANWLGGTLIGNADLPIAAVSIDSRQISGQSLFVALSGRYTDGHRYLSDVLADGSNAALIEADYARRAGEQHLRWLTRSGGAVCIVPDTRRALLQLAQRHIERFPAITRVAITGSVGKTATKELAGAILAHNGPTFMTRENFNSDIGLPLEAFRIAADLRCAVFEMGMNRPGEIADLAGVVRPDVALITNIGRAHIGELGESTIEAIAREKAGLFSCFDGTQRALIHEDEPLRELLRKDLHGTVVWYGRRSTAGFEKFENCGLAGSRLHWNGHVIDIRLVGDWQLDNILGAIAIARELSCNDEQIVAGLKSVAPLFGRGEVIEGRVTIIQDCYNASPESTNAALMFLNRLVWPGRKVCVLGPLKELGDWSATVHREVLKNACMVANATLFVMGQEYGTACEAIRKDGCAADICCYSDYEQLRAALMGFLRPGDLVLLKGSRSAGLERLTPEIAALDGAPKRR